GDEHKTFGEMSDVFGERGFAVTIVLALSLPALPIPTGGITHVFEAVAVLLAVEMILGRRTMWLPRRVRERELGPTLANRALPFIVKRIRWLEKYSRRRGAALFGQRWFLRVLGLVVVAFAIGSAVAPPFSGLDTLPALGAVVVALSILLEDVVILVVGLLIGTGGIALIITIGAALAHFLRSLF
ncbi:MAG TPA: exopolysaccharide biosynthesis protein, partial [Acidimicrobiales bacterium]|nr:exopolysaccharide biosynthesis protein [Acidimicrobiales bacterium]